MSLFEKYREKSDDPQTFVNFIENQFSIKDFDKLIANEYTNKLVIEFKPTDNCNFDCSYCCFHDNTTKHLSREQFNNYKKILIERGTDKDEVFLFIYGGEPTMHPDILIYINELSQIYNDKKVKILIQTNGQKWDIKEYTVACDFFDIHNLNASFSFSFHEEFSKLDQITKRIKYLLNRNRFDVMTYMITKDNIKRHLSIINILKHLDIPIYVRTILQESEWFLKNDKYNKYITRDLDDKSFVLYANDTISKMAFEDLTMNGYLNFKGYYCTAGVNSVLLSANGKIYRCDMDFLYDKDIMYDVNKDNKLINDTQYIKCTHKFCSIYYGDKHKEII